MRTIALALVSVLAAGCATTRLDPQIQSAAAASAPVSQYRTFSFGWTENPPTAYQASPRALEVERDMRGLVAAALREKGYVEQSANPNFLVRFTAGTQTESGTLNVEADPEWSFREIPVEREVIKVDIFDANTMTEVWHGSAASAVDLNKAIDYGQLHENVEGILASFPTRASVGQAALHPLATRQ